MTTNLQDLTNQYIAVWNEADARKRRSRIESLWAPDGVHFTPTREFRGHDALELRVEEAHGEFARDKGLVVRLSGQSSGHHGIAKFYWEIIDPRADAVVALGFDVLRLDESDRIASDHQFIEPLGRRA